MHRLALGLLADIFVPLWRTPTAPIQSSMQSPSTSSPAFLSSHLSGPGFDSDRAGPESALPRSDKFYFPDGNVVFKVENTLFNVHRFFFARDSQFFNRIFSDKVGFGLGNIPLTEPIELEGIDINDFEAFLSILYPTEFGYFDATTSAEWTSILTLSIRWSFRSVTSLAIRQLADLASPIHKIALGRKHPSLLAHWLPDAYRAVCTREDALTLQEALQLGLAEVVKIAQARQAIRRNTKRLIAEERLVAVLDEVFELRNSQATPEGPGGAELVSAPPSPSIDFPLAPEYGEDLQGVSALSDRAQNSPAVSFRDSPFAPPPIDLPRSRSPSVGSDASYPPMSHTWRALSR